VKPGDLVKLGRHKTRRGIGYEDKIGIVLKVAVNNVVTVDFAGMIIHLGIEDVRVISEAR